jgi:outer membrane protein TolC
VAAAASATPRSVRRCRNTIPKFSLSGLVGTATTAGGSLFQGSANQAQGVLGLRWRLFDFGRVGAEVKAAQGAQRRGLAAYQQSVLRATEDVEDAFSSLVKREDQERVLADGAYKAGAVAEVPGALLASRSRLQGRRGASA